MNTFEADKEELNSRSRSRSRGRGCIGSVRQKPNIGPCLDDKLYRF